MVSGILFAIAVWLLALGSMIGGIQARQALAQLTAGTGVAADDALRSKSGKMIREFLDWIVCVMTGIVLSGLAIPLVAWMIHHIVVITIH